MQRGRARGGGYRRRGGAAALSERLRQSLRHRGAAGCAAARAQLAAALAYGLYAEQFSGTAFTAPRHANRRCWLYRIRPAAVHGSFAPLDARRFTSRFDERRARARTSCAGIRCRCRARRPISSTGWCTLGGNGSPDAHSGCGIHWYAANRSMTRALLLRRRRRAADRAAAGRGCALATELGRDRGRAAGDRGDSARPALSRRAARGRRARLRLRELRRAASSCRISGRSAPTASPTRATS